VTTKQVTFYFHGGEEPDPDGKVVAEYRLGDDGAVTSSLVAAGKHDGFMDGLRDWEGNLVLPTDGERFLHRLVALNVNASYCSYVPDDWTPGQRLDDYMSEHGITF